MLSEEDFKCKYLQCPITFLTEENLDKLETHCRKAANFERGVEHKVVLELLERYYRYQKEIYDKNNKITKLQKENEEKDKEIKTWGEQLELKQTQIELMAKAFKQDDTRSVEEIIEYFKNKAKYKTNGRSKNNAKN